MKINNNRLLAKSAVQEISKNQNQFIPNIINQPTQQTEQETKKQDKNVKIVENRLYNKRFQNSVFVPKNETNYFNGELLKSEDKNKVVNFIIRTREPTSTVLTENNKNNENNLNNSTIFKNQMELFSNENINKFKNPILKELFAYNCENDIILKGTNIIIGVNKYGLFGTSSLTKELETLINSKYVGIKYAPSNTNCEYMLPLFKYNNMEKNFNCIKIVYKNSNNEQKIVTNVNLYDNNLLKKLDEKF
jgi:hypothetical protein